MKKSLGLCSELHAVDGAIDYLQQNFVGIRSPSALLHLFGRGAFGQPFGMTIHQFGETEDPESIVAHRKGWLDTILA